MVCSKKQRGIIFFYSPQVLWDLSAILVGLFCLINFIEILNIESLFFLLKIRIVIQIFFGFLFVLKFIFSVFIKKRIDIVLVISGVISSYIFGVSLINYNPGVLSLTTLFSTVVWPPLFIGFIISSISGKKVDLTFSTVVFGFISLVSLASYLYLYFNSKLTGSLTINSLYYCTIGVLFLFSLKNKIIYLILLLIMIGLSIFFGKITFALAALFGIVYYFFNLISLKKPKIFNIISNILIAVIIASAVGLMVLILTESSFIDFLSKASNHRIEIYRNLLTDFASSSPLQMIFGHGFDAVYHTFGISAHSDYLEVLFDYGIFGLCIFIFVIVAICRRTSKIKNHKQQSISFAILAFVGVFMLSSHVLFVLKYSPMLFMLVATTVRDASTPKDKQAGEKTTIAWILADNLPLPNVKGGATETILQNLIDFNENKSEYNFVIISKFDKDAYEKSKSYKNTTFYYLKDNLFTKTYDFIYHCFYKITKAFVPRHYAIVNLYKKVRVFEAPDVCIFDGNYSQASSIEGDEKFILYLHILPLMLKQHNGKGLISRLDETWVISDFVKNELSKYLKEKDNSKIKVLMNSIKLDNFRFDKSERKAIRTKLGYKDSDFVILFCGRMDERKGILDLVEAVENLADNYKLLIVGSPFFGKKMKSSFYNELKNKCKSNDNIKLTGYIDNDELYKYYSCADLFCSPSRCFEAAGLVNIEATACGLPVLTARDGGIPQYMGENCAYINEVCRIESIKDNILMLSKDKKMLQSYKENGLKHSKNFSTDAYYENFKKHINGLMNIKENGHEN